MSDRRAVQTIELYSGSPEAVGEQFSEGIEQLRSEYYGDLYPPHEARVIVGGTSTESWNDPNVSATATQQRKNPEVVVATSTGGESVLGFAYVADDVSSRRAGLAGTLERYAKMNVGRYQDAKYLWFRELIAEKDLVADALVVLAQARRNPFRTATIYPWQPETTLVQRLDRWGFAQTDDFEPTQFQDTHLDVVQGRFTAPLKGIQQAVSRKRGQMFVNQVNSQAIRLQ